ncbi:hypothetical protein FHS15_005720 [Paenibacillus castaneae]|uniref:hypothetical protein n=1 Tax=Paenibacillus castaneae TaxID=474957 RepID=UPI00141AF44C|nr:hypothetical protein [Paenibacillus castaneae]NIK80530.1 hypothetical protein [Paenibacillus castaneae]
MFYSDEDFCEKVSEKPGNIKVFKDYLRKYQLIQPRRQLSDEHIPIFEKIRVYREKENSTWVKAMDTVLSSHGSFEPTEEVALLREILETLKRIEQKLT